ncbi:gas vesicle protein [Streptomyces sp. ISL-10]|uniref:gas vesicle protein GvpO n=1 Tax=Streptomyces sp. ISL-10 TaxID=2819172 RepID=UPI001BEC41A5|nr:gas vesicle protein [Streptomyces sp. ISL-10]MBT2365655.1 gas vesicle protein [Streptomyces sp. ISL-10]
MSPERQAHGHHPDDDPREERRREARRDEGQGSRQRLSAPKAMRSAAGQLKELLGRVPESISALRPTDEGWEAEVEVLELERIPDTTSVLASYRVTLDADGELLEYERIRRYTRGQIDPRT